mmetsp:Transcript_140624/g.350583  ORF Transcript_140624/g.350583 Transcript_140624/m.350583 type:complete len:284 (+) Transcript_140624:624-1475(+)
MFHAAAGPYAQRMSLRPLPPAQQTPAAVAQLPPALPAAPAQSHCRSSFAAAGRRRWQPLGRRTPSACRHSHCRRQRKPRRPARLRCLGQTTWPITEPPCPMLVPAEQLLLCLLLGRPAASLQLCQKQCPHHAVRRLVQCQARPLPRLALEAWRGRSPAPSRGTCPSLLRGPLASPLQTSWAGRRGSPPDFGCPFQGCCECPHAAEGKSWTMASSARPPPFLLATLDVSGPQPCPPGFPCGPSSSASWTHCSLPLATAGLLRLAELLRESASGDGASEMERTRS